MTTSSPRASRLASRLAASLLSLASLTSLASLASLAACDSEPADIAGTYSANLTRRENGCGFTNWETGSVIEAVPVIITQTDAEASADVGGLAGLALDLSLGAHIFAGDVDGSSFTLKIIGTRAQTSGNCTYTFNAELAGRASGDSISGRLSFVAATNRNSDCATIEACVSAQEFAASRPPR